ncbi:hypothetical protein BGW37DRAFT_291422 [Umbelopsis sp. PMI_123]|nr:hypothetical protein BGW37DRAFT_291422 [Umbelopsis sp. PMI_123]
MFWKSATFIYLIMAGVHLTTASPILTGRSWIRRQESGAGGGGGGVSKTTIIVPCILGAVIICAVGFCLVSRHKAKKRRETAVKENRRVTRYQQRPKTMIGARPSSMFRPWSMISGSSQEQQPQGDRVSVLYSHHRLVDEDHDQYYKSQELAPPMPQYAMDNVVRHGGSRSPSPLRY